MRGAGDAPTCSVVVLTFNSAGTLEACLASVRPQADALGGDVLVVDNASDDGSVAVARRAGVEVVRAGANLGFAAGCNLGAQHARGQLLVFVNPDARLDDGCLRALVAAADADPTRGPLGARARHDDGAYDPRCSLARPTLAGALAFAVGFDTLLRALTSRDPEHGPLEVPADGAVRDVPALSGALLMVPRPLWELLGGFDERYFLYGEDVDLCVRAARRGARPVLVTGAGYRHVGGISADGGGWRRTLLYRGKAQLYRDHLPPRAARFAVLSLQVGALARGLPSRLPLGRLAARAAPWWRLYRDRRTWRDGHESREHEARR